MSQDALAGLAGCTQSYISKIESGERVVERRSTLVAIAAALSVTVADLLGQPGDPTDPVRAGAAASVVALRTALIEVQEGERRTPSRSRDGLQMAASALTTLRLRADYVAMAGSLPSLLLDAAAYGGVNLARVGYEAAICLKNLGYRDLALPAARVALGAALAADDPAWIGATRYCHTVTLPIEAPAMTSRIAGRALEALQATAANGQVRQMLGQLHLSAALACAVDKRSDDAMAHLQAAQDEARTLGGDPDDGMGFNLLGFGPTNIGLWRMTVAAELGEHGRVIEISDQITPQRLKAADRHYSYWLNRGLALACAGRSDREALFALMRAESAAPLPFGLSAAVHAAVTAILLRTVRRSIPRELKVMARHLGITVPT